VLLLSIHCKYLTCYTYLLFLCYFGLGGKFHDVRILLWPCSLLYSSP
jgi:hypothetical protein